MRIWHEGCESGLDEVALPLGAPPRTELEVEIGFGKGRYLLAQAETHPGVEFLGIESALEYYSLACQRAARRGLGNVTLVAGEALYLLATCLAPATARAVHVYFPDPWPKARHQRRRLLGPASVDLVLGLLRDGGRVFFASDHQEYAAQVLGVLREHPAVETVTRARPWPGGPRTNYEEKYEAEGRSIVRAEATRLAGSRVLRPELAVELAGGQLEEPTAK